jgi:hypothetical protein
MEIHQDNDQFFRFEKGQGKCIINGNEYEVAQDTAVGLPIDGFLLDVGVGIALLVPEGVFHSDVIRIEEVKTVVLLKALRGFVPFQHFFLGDATGVVVNVIVLQVAVQEFLILHFEYGLCFHTAVVGFGIIGKVVCTVNGCCAYYVY